MKLRFVVSAVLAGTMSIGIFGGSAGAASPNPPHITLGGVTAAQPSPLNPNPPVCSFPGDAYWTYCNTNAGSQAWIGTLEDDRTFGFHHNLHLQEWDINTTWYDVHNYHIYYVGKVSNGQGQLFEWHVWDQNTNLDTYWFANTGACSIQNTYQCAAIAAADFKDYIVNQGLNSQIWPNLGPDLMTHDGRGHPGNLPDAFCDLQLVNCKPA